MGEAELNRVNCELCCPLSFGEPEIRTWDETDDIIRVQKRKASEARETGKRG